MTKTSAAQAPPGTILFEFRQIGNAVKVTAMHVETDTEVCVQGPPSAGQHALRAAALRKLAYVLARRERNPGGGR